MAETYPYLPAEELAGWLERYSDPDRWRRALARDDARVLVAAAPTGEIVGVCQLAMPNPDGWWDEGLYLGSIYVRERGRGIGTRLVERALELAREFPVELVRAEVSERNERARGFLSARGFEPCGEPAEWLGVRWLGLCRRTAAGG